MGIDFLNLLVTKLRLGLKNLKSYIATDSVDWVCTLAASVIEIESKVMWANKNEDGLDKLNWEIQLSYGKCLNDNDVWLYETLIMGFVGNATVTVSVSPVLNNCRVLGWLSAVCSTNVW